jgi:hypothetical protein
MQIVRQTAFSYVISEPLPARRGFYFKLAAAFEKEVDALSGMTVNLMDIDEWLKGFIESIPANGFAVLENHAEEILRQARGYLHSRAVIQNAQLISLCLSEERNWSLAWNKAMPADQYLFECSHFFESIHVDCPALLQIFFQWQVSCLQDFDFSYESLKLLKSSGLSSMSSIEDNIQKLNYLFNTSLKTGGALKNIWVANKEYGYAFCCRP